MRIRIKFSKLGPLKFVGHLDMVRFFQRVMKRANIPVAYSKGFNPHPLTYFALPLSVGVQSMGEYMDIVTAKDIDREELKACLCERLPKGIEIKECFEVKENSASLMSLVKAATYNIVLEKESFSDLTAEYIVRKLEQQQLLVQKKTKKGYKEVDIKPLILDVTCRQIEEGITIELKAYAGSEKNLGVQLFLQALLGQDALKEKSYTITRKELYTKEQEEADFIAISQYGRNE